MKDSYMSRSVLLGLLTSVIVIGLGYLAMIFASLILGGTALGALLAAAGGVGVFVSRRSEETVAEGAAPTPPPEERFMNRFEQAPGTRPEITANPNFYRIDINSIPPRVDESNWRPELDGLVENPLPLTLEEIRARPSMSQYITLSYISNASATSSAPADGRESG